MKKILASLLMLMAIAPQAFAHAIFTDSFPKANSVIDKLPDEAWVEFDGTLQQFENVPVNKLVITDQNGTRLDDGQFKVGGARVGVRITKKALGTVTFSYRVVSEDGHPVEGKFLVTVNSNATMPAPAVTKAPKTSTTIASAKVAASSTKNVSTPLPEPSHIVQHGFFEHHALHISEGLIAFFLILGWAFYRKYK